MREADSKIDRGSADDVRGQATSVERVAMGYGRRFMVNGQQVCGAITGNAAGDEARTIGAACTVTDRDDGGATDDRNGTPLSATEGDAVNVTVMRSGGSTALSSHRRLDREDCVGVLPGRRNRHRGEYCQFSNLTM